MTAEELIAFERQVAGLFDAGKIRGPVHLSGGNEAALISTFSSVPRSAWVFSSWRNHYHAILHGVPRERVLAEIIAGRSMNLYFPEYRFFSSAIVGGILPIACGVAATGHEAWCFIGDMTARTGIAFEVLQYTAGHGLPLHIVVEDNGLSTNTPTEEAWGKHGLIDVRHYTYKRTYPHVGTGRFVHF